MASTSPGQQLSIVVAASHGASLLERCLFSLEKQAAPDNVEVVVVSNYDAGEVLARFSSARYIAAPKGTMVPMLRTLGIRASHGDVVALSEDNVVFDPAWSEALIQAHAAGHRVVGGAVENLSLKPLDWAVYLYEYGRYMPPNDSGRTATLAGNNVSYARPVLAETEDLYRDGFFEAFLHPELQRRGFELYLEPAAIVYHTKRHRMVDVLWQCFHHGRGYAGMRVASRKPLLRFAMGLGALALPVLLPGRIAAGTLRKKRHTADLYRALPHLTLFMSAWAFGELLGYVAGAGASARKWN
ncbi:MAG TPA: glycosyltransferase [Rhodothermales bacterium]|nr:glycosyltransferase [Rhodothermales bacterium]